MKDENEILKALMTNNGKNYIMDDGFTSKVMGSLPKASHGQSFFLRRNVMIMTATIIGCSVSGLLCAPALPVITNNLIAAMENIHVATDTTFAYIYLTAALACASSLGFWCLKSIHE